MLKYKLITEAFSRLVSIVTIVASRRQLYMYIFIVPNS